MNSKPEGDVIVPERGERGFSAIQLLVVVAIIAIISVMATVSISKAQQQMRRENVIREFKGYLEKARLDSIRRHATSTQSDGTSVTPLFTIVNTVNDGSSSTVLNLTSMGDASVGTAANVTTPTRTNINASSNVKSETNTNSSYNGY